MKNQYIALSLLFVIISLMSCNQKPHHQNTAKPTQSQSVVLNYAKGFSITHSSQYTTLQVGDPWDTSRIMQRYILIPRKAPLPDSLPEGTLVRTPVKKVLCAFAPHVAFLSRLGCIDNIAGVAEIKYIQNTILQQKFTRREIIEVGPPENMNLEKVIDLNPDLLIVSPFKDNKFAQIEASGIPVAFSADYMEPHPLARVEWIKFIAAFFEKEHEAALITDSIINRYNTLRKNLLSLNPRPAVFTNKPWGGIWYASAGDSYMAKLISDAGAQYIFADRPGTDALAIDFEVMYEKAAHNDFWLLLDYQPQGLTYNMLLQENSAFADFDAFTNKKVILCNTALTPYYEDGVMEPDKILFDLASIFHPDKIKQQKNKYFQLLK